QIHRRGGWSCRGCSLLSSRFFGIVSTRRYNERQHKYETVCMLCHGLSSSALLCRITAAPGKLYSADDPIGGPNDPPDIQFNYLFGCPRRDVLIGVSSAIQSQPVW